MTEKTEKSKRFRDEAPYEADERDMKVCRYIAKEKKSYFQSNEFQDYRKKVFVNEYLIRQKWRNNERKTRFGFKLATGRAYWEYIIAKLENTFDVDEWVTVFPKKGTEGTRQTAKETEKFANNVLDAVGYTDHIFKRMRYIPTRGWSVTFTDFHYQEGWKVTPQAKEGAIGGIEYLREYDTLRNQPKPTCIDPLNTWQSLVHNVWDSPYKGYIKRWFIRDVVDAMSKKDADKKPLYNLEALEKIKAILEKDQKEMDSDFFNGQDFGQTFSRSELHMDGKDGPYIDVSYRIGNLGGCEGYYGDPNEYIIECTEKLILRKSENPADNYCPINHIQSDPLNETPFPLTPLDKIVPHVRINDLMMNYSIETTLDDLTRYIAIREDSFLNPERLKNPKGVLNLLYVDDTTEFFEPKLIGGDQRSGALDNMKTMVEFLDRDRQRSGVTDQEMGIQGDTQDKTATSAQILKSSASETKQAMIRRFMRQGLLEEMRYIVLLALTHYEPEQLQIMGEPAEDDGDPVEQQLELNHVEMWLSKGNITWRDGITRDKEKDNVHMLEWAEFAKTFLQNQPPEYTVKLTRALGQNKDVPTDIIDAVVPDIETPQQAPPEEELPPEEPPAGIVNFEQPPQAPPMEQPIPPSATMPA